MKKSQTRFIDDLTNGRTRTIRIRLTFDNESREIENQRISRRSFFSLFPSIPRAMQPSVTDQCPRDSTPVKEMHARTRQATRSQKPRAETGVSRSRYRFRPVFIGAANPANQQRRLSHHRVTLST